MLLILRLAVDRSCFGLSPAFLSVDHRPVHRYVRTRKAPFSLEIQPVLFAAQDPFGLRLGRDGKPETGQGPQGIAEGVFTAQAALALAETLGVEVPITAAVEAVLNGRADIDNVIAALLARPFREEAQ